MRSYETVLMQAELVASRPEVVAAYLKMQSTERKVLRPPDDYDDELEKALLDRNDPLINLSLARYAFFQITVTGMFVSAEPDSPIRLACLANKNVQGQLFSRFPVALFGGDTQMLEWLANPPSMEAYPFFQNPTIDGSFLRDLLNRDEKKSWASVSDDRLGLFVSILASNPRMWEPYDDSHLDGYAEYSHNAVFDAAWELARKVEPTERWARVLSNLYHRLLPSYGLKEPLAVAGRWLTDPKDEAAMNREAESVAQGHLSAFQGVRKGLTRLALYNEPGRLMEFLNSPDPAVRCAVYAHGALTAAQAEAAYIKDSDLAYMEMFRNESLWRTAEGRAALSRNAWAVVNADKHSDLLAVNIFNGVKTEMAKAHPDWFVEDGDNEQPDPDEGPAAKADLYALGERIDGSSIATAFTALKKHLDSINSRTGWIWWFSLVAAVLAIKRF
jgi:hypothetical protein